MRCCFGISSNSICGLQHLTLAVRFASKIDCKKAPELLWRLLYLVVDLSTIFNALLNEIYSCRCAYWYMHECHNHPSPDNRNTELSSFDFRGKKALSKKKLKRRQKVKSKVKSRTKVSQYHCLNWMLLLLNLTKWNVKAVFNGSF